MYVCVGWVGGGGGGGGVELRLCLDLLGEYTGTLNIYA